MKYARFVAYGWKIHRMRKRVAADPASRTYRDLAITKVVDAETEVLEMFDLNSASRAAVGKARRQAESRKLRARSAAEAEPHIDAAE